MALKDKPILIAILSSLITVVIMSTILLAINHSKKSAITNNDIENYIRKHRAKQDRAIHPTLHKSDKIIAELEQVKKDRERIDEIWKSITNPSKTDIENQLKSPNPNDSTPFGSKIIYEINNAPPLQRAHTEAGFTGLKIKWSLKYNDGVLNNNIANIILTNTENEFYVSTKISIDDYPQLMNMHKGANVVIQGMVDKIDYKKCLIYIKNPSLKFF
jgi:hypothetical protein